MIVCSCHIIADHEVRRVIENERPTMSQVYRSLGHEPQCGRCTQTIRQIMVDLQTARGISAA